MTHFIPLPEEFIVAVSMVSAFCVIIQSAALILSLNCHRRGLMQRLETLLEAFILAQVFLFSVLITQISTHIRNSVILPSAYHWPRLILFGVVGVLAVIVSCKKRVWHPLISVIAGFFMLPLAEDLAGGFFPVLYVACLVYFILHSIHICVLRQRELKTSLSELSIKEAIDALQTGILFCEPDGRMILINKKMQSLMLLLTGVIWRNGIDYYSHITQGKLLREAEEAELDGRMVFRLQDKSVWLFNDTLLKVGARFYHQITAANVTEQWDATAFLHEQNIKLDRRRAELTQTIANLQTIYQKEEALRAKSRIHDVLGQQIALLIRSLREDEKPDETLLHSFTQDRLLGLAADEPKENPAHYLRTLVEMMDGIGVALSVQGCLPENTRLAGVFTEIITEGVTNAIRHGFAKKIEIACKKEQSVWTLSIGNNGLPPAGPVTEGGGIAGIRRKLLAMGGALIIETRPRFLLKAVLSEEG